MPNPKKILIVSVLKPVDDVRHFRKIARSIASANKYEIFIIGKGYLKNSGQANIHFLLTGNIGRFSLRRLIIPFLLLKNALRIRPAILIINAPELLPMGALIKRLTNAKFIYDVQENYYKNITYQKEYEGVIKTPFLTGIKILKFFERYVDHFLLAERIYEAELNLPKSRVLILENKTAKEDVRQKTTQNSTLTSPLKVLISGTLSPYTDPISGILLFRRLSERYRNATLTVVGKVLNADFKNKIIKATEGFSKIELLLDLSEVPYDLIRQHFHTADLGIIAYSPNEVNQFRIPTKLFEYSANRIPYLLRKDTFWEETGMRLGGAIGIDFDHPDLDKVQQTLENQEMLFKGTDPLNSIWIKEEEDLIELIKNLTH